MVEILIVIVPHETMMYYNSSSSIFYLGSKKVKCFKLISPYGVGIDVMFMWEPTEFEKIKVGKLSLKVQNPKYAFEVKREYNKLVNRKANPESSEKHKRDLEGDDIPF